MTQPATVQAQVDEDLFAAAVAEANIPCLLMVLVQLTGDLRWLEDRYRAKRTRGMEDDETGGLPETVQDEVRGAALDAILRWRRGQPAELPRPADDLIVRMLSHSMGETVPDDYGVMLAAELLGAIGVHEQDRWRATSAPDGFRVLIVGAGISGICAGARLRAAGIQFTIIERHDTVGGVWLENRYPGAGVDTPSLLYSFSFSARDWTHYFADRDEVQDYLETVADAFGVRDHIRFRTEVDNAAYDEERQRWLVKVRTKDGAVEVLEANVLVSAVGAFNAPLIPKIPGLDRFEGSWFHTARWPEGLDLSGKRVAVVGNGASAMQVVPAIADTVASLTIFQRAPQWAQPFPLFKKRVPDGVKLLLRDVPFYRAWARLRLGWIFHDKLYDALQKDPQWPHPDRSLNATNDRHREYLAGYIRSELGDREDLARLLVPNYPPFGKRMLMDNGWYRTLTKPHVALVTDTVAEIDRDHVVTVDGAEHHVDVIVFATGFDVVRFVSTFEVRGCGGRSLREAWNDDDGRAFLGLAVPDFPNFFCLYGPNTQPGHGGSLVFTVEAQMDYVMSVLQSMFDHDLASVECRRDVYDQYNHAVDAAHENMIWTHPGMSTYYRNSRGRVVVNSPFRNLDFWKMTRRAELDDYIAEPHRRTAEVRA